MWAIYSEDLLLSSYLIRTGSDLNIQATRRNCGIPKGATALIIAIRMGLPDIARMLVERGARTDLRDAKGKTASEIARESGFGEGYEFLGLQAVRGPDMERIFQGVSKGGEVQAPDASGATPLMHAAHFQDTACAELLLSRGARPDTQTLQPYKKLPKGATALIIASSYGAERVVSALLAHGADRDIKDSSGRTAFSYAKESGFDKICYMLKGKDMDPTLESYYPNLEISVFSSEPMVVEFYPKELSECRERLKEAIHFRRQYRLVEENLSPTPAQATLLVRVDFNDVHIPSRDARATLGILMGRSHIQAKVQLMDRASGRLLREKTLDSGANTFLSALTSGGHDSTLPEWTAFMILDWVEAVNRKRVTPTQAQGSGFEHVASTDHEVPGAHN